MGRYKPKGFKAFLCILVSQMLPASLMLTPMYLTFSKIHLLGTYFARRLRLRLVPFRLPLLRSGCILKAFRYFDEAARIDGCGSCKVIFPCHGAGGKDRNCNDCRYFIFKWLEMT